MKVDGGIPNIISKAGAQAAELEKTGYSGGWTAETSHDPFLPLVPAAEATSDLELGTSIAVAFARNPMTLANTAWDLQMASAGPLHPRPRQPDQAAHHEALLDGLEPPGGRACGR